MALNAMTPNPGRPYGFEPLDKEKILHVSPTRTTLELKSPNSYPGKQPLAIEASAGHAIITNQRDTTVTYPYFGANSWIASLKTVPDGNIYPHHQYVELKLTFKDGGVTEFDATYKRVKEALLQAIDVARESRHNGVVDLSTVHLDQLPEYSETNNTNIPIALYQPMPISPVNISHPSQRDSAWEDGAQPQPTTDPQVKPFQPPSEPPPGYEEAQSSVVNDLEQRIQQSE